MPTRAALVLDTLPWPTDIRSLDELQLAAIGKTAADLKPAELKMAAKLINDMTDSWQVQAHTAKFSAAISVLVNRKVAVDQTVTVTALKEIPSEVRSSTVVDLAAQPAVMRLSV